MRDRRCLNLRMKASFRILPLTIVSEFVLAQSSNIRTPIVQSQSHQASRTKSVAPIQSHRDNSNPPNVVFASLPAESVDSTVWNPLNGKSQVAAACDCSADDRALVCLRFCNLINSFARITMFVKANLSH